MTHFGFWVGPCATCFIQATSRYLWQSYLERPVGCCNVDCKRSSGWQALPRTMPLSEQGQVSFTATWSAPRKNLFKALLGNTLRTQRAT